MPSLIVTSPLLPLPVFSFSLLSPLFLVCFPLPPSPLPSTSSASHLCHSCCWIIERMWRAPCRMGRRTTQRPHFSWPPLQVIAHKQQRLIFNLGFRWMCTLNPSILIPDRCPVYGISHDMFDSKRTRRRSHTVVINASRSITIWDSRV